VSQPYLISGQGGAPNTYQSPAQRSSPMLKILLAAWLLGGISFAAWKITTGSGKTTKPVAPVGAQAPVVTAISTEDLLHHMEQVNAQLSQAAARLRRAEELTARTIPSLERNYLLVEKQHLETALAVTEAARRDLEQGRQDADLILNSLKKEHELK